MQRTLLRDKSHPAVNWNMGRACVCVCVCVCVCARMRKWVLLCLTLWDPMHCSLPSSSVYGFSRQESWSGLPFPPPRDLPDPGIKPTSPVSCVGRWILYHWATWGAQLHSKTDVYNQLCRQAKNLLLRLREAYPLQSYIIYAQMHSFQMDISMIIFFLLICN